MNLFSANTTGYGGGGMSNFDAAPLVSNCIFSGNSALFGAGGGMENSGCLWPYSASIINCTFYGNTAGYGGGIYNNNSSTTVTNCILWGDQASIEANEIYDDASEMELTYSCIQDGCENTGNTSADPSFVDADNGDFRLQSESPCIDTGTSEGAPETDILGVSRPQGGGYDMGAYER